MMNCQTALNLEEFKQLFGDIEKMEQRQLWAGNGDPLRPCILFIPLESVSNVEIHLISKKLIL